MQNIKTLFNDDLKQKLENATVTLDAWTSLFREAKVNIVVEIEQIKASVFGSKKIIYSIKLNDKWWPDVTPATRTSDDLLLLYKQLRLRFPNSVVPPLPQETSNKFMVASYLTTLASNPFFRNDVCYFDFFDGKFKEFRMTKKKDRKLSEGVLRWLQCCTDFPTISCDELYMNTLTQEFDLMEKHHKAVLKSLISHYESMVQTEASAQSVASSFETLLAMEKASESRAPVNLAGLPPEKLADFIQGTVNMTHRHNQIIRKAYGASTYKRLFIDVFTSEIALIQAFKIQLRDVRDSMRAYERAREAANKTDGLTPSQKSKNEEIKDNRFLEFTKVRQGIVGFELNRFKSLRTEFLRTFYENLAIFNMVGSSQIHKEWAESGVDYSTNAQAEEVFFEKNLDYENQASVRGRSNSSSKNLARRSNQVNTETVALKVTTSYHPKKRRHLKITEGEMLAGHKAEQKGFWVATNKAGKKGLVAAAHVIVKSQGLGQTLSRKKQAPNYNQGTMVQTGVVANASRNGGGDNDLSDWSESSDSDDDDDEPRKQKHDVTQPRVAPVKPNDAPKKQTFTMPAKPQKPEFPPGLPFGTANPVAGARSTFKPPPFSPGPVMPTQDRNQGGANARNTPSSINPGTTRPATTTSNNGGGTSLRNLSTPGERMTLPTFGEPSNNNSSKTMISFQPGSPKIQLSLKDSKPKSMASVNESKSKPHKKKKKKHAKKRNTKAATLKATKPAAAPAAARPAPGPGPMGRPAGGPSFLADIGKGKAAVKLKKVETKESVGRVGAVVDASGGGAKRAQPAPKPQMPPMGGGGMLGELQAKLNKRRG